MIEAVCDMTGQLATPDDVRTYMLAGRATLTIRSKKTGTRFTYKINKLKDKSIWFVNVLRGPDNTSDFTYMGIIKEGTTPEQKFFTLTSKSRVTKDALSVKAFLYLTEHIFSDEGIASLFLPEQLEVWHEGHCGRCGRKLTVPESVQRGIGPECWEKM